MSDWSKYLKNAVANVEQHLDKVLLEEKFGLGDTNSNTPARSTQPSPKPSTSAARVDLETAEFATLPDLLPALTLARRVALESKSDLSLELVDKLTETNAALTKYAASERAKLEFSLKKQEAANAVKSETKDTELEQTDEETKQPDSSMVNDDELKLLRLEVAKYKLQELELTDTIKGLRQDKNYTQQKIEKLDAVDKELARAKAQVVELKDQHESLLATVEHYRTAAETSIPKEEKTINPTNLSELEAKYNTERKNWHLTESKLVAKIAELEDLCASQRKSDDQKEFKELSNRVVDLLNELTRAQDALAFAKETHAKEMKKAIDAQIKAETKALELEKQASAPTNIAKSRSVSITELPKPVPSFEPMEDPEIPPLEPLEPLEPENDSAPDSGLDTETEAEHSTNSHLEIDTQSLNSASANMDSLDSLVSPSMASEHHVNHTIGSLSTATPPGSDYSTAQTTGPAIQQLSQKLNNLQNELANAHRELSLTRSKQRITEGELVKMLNSQEELEVLSQQFGQLAEENEHLRSENQISKQQMEAKTEEIAELHADLQDIKELYKDQITALISEIERLKK